MTKKVNSFEKNCPSCDTKNIIEWKDTLKYCPKNYMKSCVKCRTLIEGEWKKDLKKSQK